MVGIDRALNLLKPTSYLWRCFDLDLLLAGTEEAAPSRTGSRCHARKMLQGLKPSEVLRFRESDTEHIYDYLGVCWMLTYLLFTLLISIFRKKKLLDFIEMLSAPSTIYCKWLSSAPLCSPDGLTFESVLEGTWTVSDSPNVVTITRRTYMRFLYRFQITPCSFKLIYHIRRSVYSKSPTSVHVLQLPISQVRR